MKLNIVEVRNLDKYYGTFQALSNVNLTIKQGEALGFLGPNGAGKSTTIRVLLGLLRKDKGNVTLFGHDAWHDSVKIHERIAYVPGDVHLWPNLTGGEIIDLFCSLRGRVDYNRKKQLIDRFELDPTKKCRTYSKGNRQKVGLISAFASSVDFYILDEPTSGLDPLMSSVFQDCVREMKKEGKTLLMSSHILDDVEKLCDRISIIRKGEIVESGTLSQMRHMTRLTIEVNTVKPVNNLMQFESIDNLEFNGLKTSFTVESTELNAIMAHLLQFNIVNITSTPPSLESIFMRHYGDELRKV